MSRLLSNEDRNLTSSIVSTRVRKYKDIDLSFAKKQTGEIYKKEDAAAVKQAIKNLLLTNKCEKPFLPSFGADLRKLLFELVTSNVSNDVKSAIINTIEAYEPRAEIKRLVVRPQIDSNEIMIELEILVKNTTQQINFSFVMSRLR